MIVNLDRDQLKFQELINGAILSVYLVKVPGMKKLSYSLFVFPQNPYYQLVKDCMVNFDHFKCCYLAMLIKENDNCVIF